MARRVLAAEAEDATLLKLGPDFNKARCLWHAEVKILLEQSLNQQDGTQPPGTTDMIEKTLKYVQTFNYYEHSENLRPAKKLFKDKPQLADFEIAALTNLMIDNADEALSLLPTLKEKCDVDELEELLLDLKRYHKG